MNEENNISAKEKNQKNYYVIIIIGVIVLLYILYHFAPSIGFLTPFDTKWQETMAPYVSIDTDNENFPLKFISDVYRFVYIKTENNEKEAAWRWKYKIKNISNKDYIVSVEFILKDKDEFEITSDLRYKKIKAGETEIIRGQNTTNVRDIRRIETRSWKIGYGENSSYRAKQSL